MVLEQRAVDRYGHSGYSVVIMAPTAVQRAVGMLRDQLDIPVPTIPAHVTVKGTFAEIPDLESIGSRVASAAFGRGGFSMELDERVVWGTEGSRVYVLRIRSSPELDALHMKLFNDIDSITTNVYGHELAEGFSFHMTLYQEVDEVSHEKGIALSHEIDFPEHMDATSMCLMGRQGPRGPGGSWHVLEEFEFSAL